MCSLCTRAGADAALVPRTVGGGCNHVSTDGTNGSGQYVDMETGAASTASGGPQINPVFDLADRGRRLFEFLPHAQMLKTSPPRTTEAYLRDGSVLWMSDLPEHAAV